MSYAKISLIWVTIFGLAQKLNLVSIEVNEPYQLFRSLYSNYDNAFILESLTGPKEMAEFSILGFDPLLKFTTNEDRIYIRHREGAKDTYRSEEPLSILKEIMPAINDDRFRYIGGAVGYISYDAINYWEDVNVKRNNYPSMEFGIYTDGILFDRLNNRVYYFYINKPRLDEIKFNDFEDGELTINKIKRNLTIEEFEDIVIKAKKYIYDGDIYQAVLSKKFNFGIKGNTLAIYSNLREINPSPYMYMLKMDDREIIGSSPEMLVRTINDRIETFPIAGTRPIGKSREENEALKQELLNDEKELAEHTMLVDLARNDLGRVCKWGSVKVEELMSIKEFSHVQHLVSHVTGILDKKDCYALKYVFPAGTVSGAPKVRAIEIIDELEKDPRGPYAGAVGYFSFNGSSDFAISIRSLFINGNNGYVQSGAGIVADSEPEKEWYETEHKAQAVLDAIKRCVEC